MSIIKKHLRYFLIFGSAVLLNGIAFKTTLAETPLLERALSDDVEVAEQARAQMRTLDIAEKKKIVSDITVRLKNMTYKKDQSAFVSACFVLQDFKELSQPALSVLGAELQRTSSYGDRKLGAQSTIMEVFAAAGATPETESLMIDKLADSNQRSYAIQALGSLQSGRVVHALLQAWAKEESIYTQLKIARSLSDQTTWSDADVKLLNAFLVDKQPSLRYAAALVYWQRFPKRTIDWNAIYRSIPFENARYECKALSQTFLIANRSFSKEMDEADQTLWVIPAGGEPRPINFDNTVDSFTGLKESTGTPSVCRGLYAFADRTGHVVIPFLTDDRPFGVQMAAVFYTPSHNQAFGAYRLGAIPAEKEPAILPLDNGFSFEEIPQPTDSTACSNPVSGSCGDFRGRKILSRTDEWISVSWDVRATSPDAVVKTVNLKKTWQQFPVKQYFRDQKDFVKTFGLDIQHNDVILWYGRLTLDNREELLCPSPTRNVVPALCRKKN